MDDAVLLPAPARRPPLMVGATGPRMLAATLPHVDAWNIWFELYSNTPEASTGNRAVDEAAQRAGRDPGAMARSACVLVVLDRECASSRAGVASWAQRDPHTGGRVEMVSVTAKLPSGSRFWAGRIDARRRLTARAGALAGAFTAGAIAQYFVFDRRHATRRRHIARERGMAIVRRRRRAAVRRARYLEGVGEGVAHRAAHSVPGRSWQREELDDVSLARKVESVAFREAGVSKAHVSVNAETGVVYLRGRLENEREIEDLVRAAAAVEGVARVENLLHTPRFRTAG